MRKVFGAAVLIAFSAATLAAQQEPAVIAVPT